MIETRKHLLSLTPPTAAADNPSVTIVVGVVFAAAGCALFAFSTRLARHGVSLQFSDEEIRGTSGPLRRWVRPVKAVATVMYMVMGAFFIYAGVRLI